MTSSLDHLASDIWSKVGLSMQLGWLTLTKQILQIQSPPRQGPNDEFTVSQLKLDLCSFGDIQLVGKCRWYPDSPAVPPLLYLCQI